MTIKNKVQSTNIMTLRAVSVVALVSVFVIATIFVPMAKASVLQQQIDALNAANSQKEAAKSQLGSEATNIGEAINRLQAEINYLQAKITDNETKTAELKTQIKAAEDELVRQKDLLGQTIRAMYLEGDISTVEMLATSKDLSDYFDKQQYRESVNSKIKTTLDKITKLKLDLNTQKETVEKLLAEQQSLQGQLAAQKAENNRLLSLNQAQQGELNAQLQANSGKISELRKQQAAENARLFSRSGGVRNIPDSTGYPWANYRAGNWTHAGSCNYGDDMDNFGMCYRQCVSYAAWKTWKTHGYEIQNWGDAKNWAYQARAHGKVVDGSPRPGDIAVSTSGTWGHVMFVESVNGGKINISQYNASLTGTYSEATISASGLSFIHFN